MEKGWELQQMSSSERHSQTIIAGDNLIELLKTKTSSDE